MKYGLKGNTLESIIDVFANYSKIKKYCFMVLEQKEIIKKDLI